MNSIMPNFFTKLCHMTNFFIFNDSMWKIRNIFDTLNNFGELHYSTEHITIDEVIVLFKGRVVYPKNIRDLG